MMTDARKQELRELIASQSNYIDSRPAAAMAELLAENERLEKEKREFTELVRKCVWEEWDTAKAIHQQECDHSGSTDAKRALWNRIRNWERFAHRIGIDLEEGK